MKQENSIGWPGVLYSQNREILNYFIQSGVDICAVNSKNKTALELIKGFIIGQEHKRMIEKEYKKRCFESEASLKT